MDQSKAREAAKDAAEQASNAVNETVQRVGAQVQPALDQGKAAVQDLANRD
jgi:ABC-type transporter Mla subunit MlaD